MVQDESEDDVVMLVLRGAASNVAAAYRELELAWNARSPRFTVRHDHPPPRDNSTPKGDPAQELAVDSGRGHATERDAQHPEPSWQHDVSTASVTLEAPHRVLRRSASSRSDRPHQPCDGTVALLRRRHHLSNCECVILALRARGCSNAEVAAVLCRKEKTVKSHVSSALRRCGLKLGTSVVKLFATTTDNEKQDDDPFCTADDEWRGQLGVALGRLAQMGTSGSWALSSDRSLRTKA